jgi:DNA-binding protein H-NS
MSDSESIRPFSDYFRYWKEQTDRIINSQDPIVTELSKSAQEVTKLIKASNRDIKQVAEDMQTIKIELRIPGEVKPRYVAHIKLDGDWVEELPAIPPSESDIYWLRFKEMVNKTREERKEITNKAIEVAGNSISKVINPLTISPIDITQLIQLLSGGKKNKE